MKKLLSIFILISSLYAVDVTFTVVDNSWSNMGVMYKGTATEWAPVMMYDDGTNGDATADDHTWTVVVDVMAGDHEWGAFDVANGDGTSCVVCDGTDGYGTWLINGSNPSYSVDDAMNVTGTTSYTIDAYTTDVAGSLVFTVDDRSQANVSVEYKGAATNWETVPMFDDGTNGDAVAGDNVWSVTIENIPAGTHEWGAIENDGSEYGIWLINGPNPAFTLDDDLVTYHGHTNYTIPVPAGEMEVAFTLTDHTWMIEDVMFKGSMSGWGVFQAYDDGTNGDVTAGDHVWTAHYTTANGDYQWGAIDTENPDGTICVACDGTDGYGTWLMEGDPNPEFSVLNGELTGVTSWVLPPDSAVSEGVVMFTVHDGTEEWTDLMFKGTPTDWSVVQMYDDGTNGDETAGDHVWSAVVPAVMAGEHSWGVIDTDNGDDTECEACDGTDGYGTWLIDGDNPAFTLDTDMLTLHGQTDYEIVPAGGNEVTKTVLFNVDLTEWLDEEGNMGMRVFNIANGDEMQVRGSFNNWGNCTECTMTRTPGTNIFSHAIEVSALEDAEQQFAYYMHLSEASLAAAAERFNAYDSEGNPAIVDWIGWETSPQNNGNRNFMLGEDDGTGLVELPEESFYDAFPGSVVPEGTSVTAVFSIDMSNVAAFDAAEDSVYLRTHDKWLNLSQGYSDGQDLNHYAATAVGDGVYEFPVTLSGPVTWNLYYKWGWYDLSEATENDEAGGGLGGAPRIRYLHQDMDANCEWPMTFRFPLDTEFLLEENDAQEEWDPEGICMVLMAVDGNGGASLPSAFSISNNYPNPFNPSTEMEFRLPIESDISFTVYSLTGKEMYSYTQSAVSGGTYKITWNGKSKDGRSLPSGVYLYEFRAGNEFRQVKKMTLLK